VSQQNKRKAGPPGGTGGQGKKRFLWCGSEFKKGIKMGEKKEKGFTSIKKKMKPSKET